MKFYQYLTEGRSKEITDIRKIKELLNTKFKESFEAYKRGIYYYRGNRGNTKGVYLTDPSKFNPRISPYASANYYNLLLSNLPSWKKYPKRNMSIIGTTDTLAAGVRGTIFYIFPQNGAKIGVCPASDIWYSFKENDIITYNLNDLNNFLTYLLNSKNENNWGALSKQLKDIKMDGDLIKKYFDDFLDTEHVIIWQRLKNKYKTLYDYIDSMLNPSYNNFRLVKNGTDMPNNREIWTDAPCLLINKTHIKQLLTDLE